MVDPSMEGYLPILQQTVHEGPSEVILRFSTAPGLPNVEVQHQTQSPGEVFLHAVGATATFGKSFATTDSPHSSPFIIHSGPVRLVYHSETDGCAPFSLPDEVEGDTVLLLDRGGCPFLDKLLYASRAGAAGLIVAGLSPSTTRGMGMIDPDGLIRPSADDESPHVLKEVEGKGLVYVDWKTGDALRDIFNPDQSRSRTQSGESTVVMVEVMSFDGQTHHSGTGPVSADGERSTTSTTSSKGQAREGRVGVGEHVIWNLRIVEVPP